MNKTPWVLAVVQTLVALALGFTTYVSRENWERIPTWLHPAASFVAGQEYWWIFVLTGIGVFFPLIDRVLGAFAFKKQRAQRILDQLVTETLNGEPQTHRVTLFKAVRGWFAIAILLRRIWHQDDRWPVLHELLRIRPWGLYLVVYARPKKARNQRSCAVYRVYRQRQRDCSGMAGLAWVNDKIAKRNVQNFEPGTLRHMRALSEYDETHPYRIYAEETNVADACQLRSREQYSRHFYGTVIVEGGSGNKWGVLLLDSTAPKCPFPESTRAGDKGDRFAQQFDRFATTLSHILT